MFEGAALVNSSCISGLNRCHRALGPSAWWGAHRPELVQPAGAIDAHYEHSGVCLTKLLGSFFFFWLSLPDRNLETSVRIHFHFNQRTIETTFPDLTWPAHARDWSLLRELLMLQKMLVKGGRVSVQIRVWLDFPDLGGRDVRCSGLFKAKMAFAPENQRHEKWNVGNIGKTWKHERKWVKKEQTTCLTLDGTPTGAKTQKKEIKRQWRGWRRRDKSWRSEVSSLRFDVKSVSFKGCYLKFKFNVHGMRFKFFSV